MGDMEPIIGPLLQLGIGGLMAGAVLWFLRYTVTVTVPEQNKVFREELQEERRVRERIAEEERISREKVLAEERQYRRETRDEFLASIRLLSDSWDRRANDIKTALHEDIQDIKKSVDALADRLGTKKT